MFTVLTIVHVFICLFLIVVVLLQAGKGGGMGIAFGGGGSQTVFGSSGAGNFLTRLTAGFAVAFFVNSLVLAYLSSQSDSKRLQSLSAQKAAEQDAKKADKDKVQKDLEAARKAIESSTGLKVEQRADLAGGPGRRRAGRGDDLHHHRAHPSRGGPRR
jgi:preprotein translocase subunit SecG